MTARADNFNRANGAVGTPSDAGSAWGQSAGAQFETFANGCVTQSGTGNQIAWLDSGTPNVQIGAAIFVVLNLWRLVLRVVSDDTYIFLQVESNQMTIFRRTSGSNTQLAQTTGLSIGDGDDIWFEVDSANDIRAYLNSGLQVSANDSQGSSSTLHGIGTNGGAIGDGFDDYFSTDLAGSSPQDITDAGAIATGEAVGAPTVTTGAVTISPGGIASGEAFGTATVSTGAVTVSPVAIASDEAFGTPIVTPGAVTVSPGSIVSEEAFGTAVVSTGAVTISPGSIASEEAFGTATITNGPITLSPVAIVTGEAFGTATISLGAVTVLPGGIGSGEAFGLPVISLGGTTQHITGAGGILSLQAFGTPTVSYFVVPEGPINTEIVAANVPVLQLVNQPTFVFQVSRNTPVLEIIQ